MARVIWRREAADDLIGITAYINRDNPAAAEQIGRRLTGLADSLTDFPNRGRPADDDTREMVTVAPYVLSYRVEDEIVYILRIRHGRQRR